jgi:hypothetical protein
VSGSETKFAGLILAMPVTIIATAKITPYIEPKIKRILDFLNSFISHSLTDVLIISYYFGVKKANGSKPLAFFIFCKLIIGYQRYC